ncbi:MAG: hypothetical protein ACYTDT_05035 [Planctomycetota bacterium]
MNKLILPLLMIFGVLLSACSGSTRVDLDDDEVGPERSGPYSSDLLEVTEMIADEFERQKVVEEFKATYGEPPIVSIVEPLNETRFPNFEKIFVADLESELRQRYNRREIRFRTDKPSLLDKIAAEKAAKDEGDRTDRTGRRTKLGADFFLIGEFLALSATDGEEYDDTIMYKYQLIDAETTEVWFDGQHKIRRVSDQDAVYR